MHTKAAIFTIKCNTQISPLLAHWRYLSSVLRHQYGGMAGTNGILYYTRHMSTLPVCDMVIVWWIILIPAGTGQKVFCNWFYMGWEYSRVEIAYYMDERPSVELDVIGKANIGYTDDKTWASQNIYGKFLYHSSLIIVWTVWEVNFMPTFSTQFIQDIPGIMLFMLCLW